MAHTSKPVHTYLALGETAESQSIKLLEPILADAIYLQNLHKKYHWHVEGEDFYQYHLLFDKHADELIPVIDTIAERIRTLGGSAPGMPDDVMLHKTIHEQDDVQKDGQLMIRSLCKVYEKALRSVRASIVATDKLKDDGTNDMLVSDVLRLYELQLWFIRSSLRH